MKTKNLKKSKKLLIRNKYIYFRQILVVINNFTACWSWRITLFVLQLNKCYPVPAKVTHRSTWVKEYRSRGIQEYRSTGVQEHRSTGVQEYRSSAAIVLSSRMLVTNRDSWIGIDWYDCRILTRTIPAIQGLSSQLDLLKDAYICPHTASHWLLQGYNQSKPKLWIWYDMWYVTCHSWYKTYLTLNILHSLMENHLERREGGGGQRGQSCEFYPRLLRLSHCSLPWEWLVTALTSTAR